VPAALITGASTGIGRAAALRLDSRGWKVFAGVRRDADGDALRDAATGSLIPLRIDLTEPDSIAAAAAEVESELGAAGLDGLVNNAGVAIPGPLETLPMPDLRRQLEVNLIGQIEVTQATLPAVRRARGRIVFISSIGGRTALPFTGAYHASKFGIEAIGDSLRQELRPWGIEVSLIEPGSVATPIWDKGQASADEISTRLPDHHDALYGAVIERYRETVRRVAARGVAPEEVADAIEQALTAPRPKTRYLIGRRAKIQARLGMLLPDRTFDRIVAREMGI
jgi:NAD(P)-dependent dehydrogenase (short-subunit alcohol dehydrogenase family)